MHTIFAGRETDPAEQVESKELVEGILDSLPAEERQLLQLRVMEDLTLEEIARRTLAVEGVLAVQAGDNPRVVREKLEAFLPLALPHDSTLTKLFFAAKARKSSIWA